MIIGNVAAASGFLTPEMIAPIAENARADLGILLPVGITLMSIMIGVSLIPRIIWKFL